jgi:hypothetical protein
VVGEYECFDHWLDAWLSLRGEPGYGWAPLSRHATFEEQIEAVGRLLAPHRATLEIARAGEEQRVFSGRAEVEAFVCAQPVGAEALIVGFDLATQDNHAIYARRVESGMSARHDRGWTWATYLVYLVRC